ncbi:MAG: GWxTD domain-containing protein [bacterium]|nr:GWxTD domain-containing protein [bacterium]
MLKLNRMNLFLVGALILIFGSNLISQENEKLLPIFDYEIVSFPTKTFQNAETDVYVWVRNTHLQYIASDSIYSARYQINIGIENQKGASVLTEDKTFSVTEKNYASTIDPKALHTHRFAFQVPPGDYSFQIRLLDLNSNRNRTQVRKKTVRSFEKNKLEVSDVLFVLESDTGFIKSEHVIPSSRIPVQEKVFVYAEVIIPENANSLKIESTLRQKDGKEGFNFSQEIIPTREITKVFLQVTSESMVRGENQLYLKVTSDGQTKAVRKDLRFVAGGQTYDGLPVDDMIGPLIYVTDADDWKKLINASAAEQDSVFKAFWETRNPSPGSPENELFNEFYKRVDLTNRNFGYSRKDGWKTDRGRVFIVFGPPDRLERSSPSTYSQGEYEVWYYEELREKFVFFDEYGFGDFRLVSGNIRPSY